MPTYDYKCVDHGYFEKRQSMKDHARADCPTCGSDSKQVLTKPPSLDATAMAYAGMPGAITKQQDRMHKAHRSEDQAHRPGGL